MFKKPSNYYMDLLLYIYKHPYTSIDEIEEYFNSPKQWRKDSHKSVGTFNRTRLCQHVDFLKAKDLVIYVPFSTNHAMNDIKADQYTFPVSIDSNIGILLTLQGSAMVSEYKISKYNYWYPWIITTIIAAISAVAQVVNIFIELSK